MDEKIRCPYCGRSNTIRRGFRKLRKRNKRVYFCKDCSHKFSLGLERKRFDVKIILSAVCAYNQGYSYEEASDIAYRRYKASVHRSTISRWVKEYDLGYSSIRATVCRIQKHPHIAGRVFKHSGLVYNFKCHKGKLNLFGKFLRLKKFVLNIGRGVDEKYFTSDNDRCSQIRNEVSSDIRVFDNTKLNKVAGSILKVVKNNNQRHSVIENLMLSCDRDTIAVEVPIWYWDKLRGVGVCGHIDVLQVKFGKVWVMDYKPNAEMEDVDKVVSQLFNYALGLSFRAGVKLSDIRCGWFDENKVYVFDADKVKTSCKSLVNATGKSLGDATSEASLMQTETSLGFATGV